MNGCPPPSSVDANGPLVPTHVENVGPNGGSWVYYPQELGSGGARHAVFNWAPGSGLGPGDYRMHLERLASHGFVVITQASSADGNGEKAALDWLFAENQRAGSTFYQKLDPKRVSAGGHSQGALVTMKIAGDPRLMTYVLACGGCLSASGGCGAANIHGPTVILGGDMDSATPNFEGDYAEIKSPVVFLTKGGTDHTSCARNNLAPWVAFMRWQMCGEESQWKSKFLMGEYCSAPWTCKSKAW